jgi:adenylate cyclase
MASTRRLTAILAADVAGYSRLMEADEEGTHERLKGHFDKLINPKIDEYRGRVVKNTGDGVVAEFASVVDAVRCAAAIQRGMIDREAESPHERRIRLRIGGNLVDIIAEGGDIFGDGVNIAARLEALAEPGGICVSGTVHDQVRNKLAYQFDDLGEQTVKNIARPIRIYGLSVVAGWSGVAAPATPQPAVPHYSRRVATVAALAGVLVIAVGVWWWLWPSPKAPSVIATAPPLEKVMGPAMPATVPRLSIVVLPFANLSDDKEQQYFADGITEDLTTDLSRIDGSFVISRNTAFTYKDKPVDAKQIGRDLGVRYVLEGSVQRSRKQVRVNAQLINAETDAHLWAERFERDIDNLFALQSEITSRIAVALGPELVIAEADRPTQHPGVLDYIFRGRAALSKPPTRDSRAEAIAFFERALALDPLSTETQSWLAIALVSRVFNQLSDTARADTARAEGLAEQATAASPRSSLAHWAKGIVLRAHGRCEEAISEYEMVLAADRNSIYALADIGACKIYLGQLDDSISFEEQAIRLSPRDQLISLWYGRIGEAYLLQSRIDQAILWFEKAREANPELPQRHAFLASAYALNGEGDRAAAELAEARKLSRDDRFSSLARLKPTGLFGSGSWGVPKVSGLFEATYFAGLRKAGMPDN